MHNNVFENFRLWHYLSEAVSCRKYIILII